MDFITLYIHPAHVCDYHLNVCVDCGHCVVVVVFSVELCALAIMTTFLCIVSWLVSSFLSSAQNTLSCIFFRFCLLDRIF